jgi:fructose-bisphosphate aldolase class 1
MKDIPELDSNLKEYRALGASFSKFRAVCRIDSSKKSYPSTDALIKNAQMLAKFALLVSKK